MVGSLALVLLGAVASPTSCESLASLKLEKAIITGAASRASAASGVTRKWKFHNARSGCCT